MKKRILTGILVAACALPAIACVGCSDKETLPSEPVNGGFESGDLSGWSVEYGNAFDDDCVSSVRTFMFDGDANHNEISVNATGNWYLTGKGFHGKYRGARTGAIRSTAFVLPSDGIVSMKLAGGALTVGKTNTYKSPEKTCYVGIYRASDDKLIAKQANDYFIEHTESYVMPEKYAAGVYNTDNFYEYTLDLGDYAGELVYIRIVDNDDSWYYGYIAVDDIRIGGDAEAQSDGAFFTKTIDYSQTADSENEYEIINGGFETGSLAGWTVVSGDAFSNEGVNSESVWWNENITYSRDGNYHYGMYKPTATGVMRSSEFTLGGSGYISFKLGGCADNGSTYIRVMQKTNDGDKEIARYSNTKYYNFQFPHVANGMRLLNMVQYYADLSYYLGETLYLEVVDNNANADDLGCITLDSVKTYWKEKPVWYDRESYFIEFDNDIREASEYQIENGGFESGDLTGWTKSWTNDADRIGGVTADSGWSPANNPYNKAGNYLFSGIVAESDWGKLEKNKGTLTSSAFTVAGSGWISFRMGGGGNPGECYIAIIDAEDNTELKRFSNRLFRDAALNWYKADLTDLMGKRVKIQLVDKGEVNWGLLTADSFVTYYPTLANVPAKAAVATNSLKPILGEDDPYQVLNGDFETGNTYGWTLEGKFGGISNENVWWGERILYNKDGDYFFNGMQVDDKQTGTLTSSAFTVNDTGWITFKIGGGRNSSLCYISIVDAESGNELLRFGNSKFRVDDDDFARLKASGSGNKDAAAFNLYLGNMVLYKADLTSLKGRNVKIKVVDKATADWGIVNVDSFITAYQSEELLPDGAVLAENLLN